MSYTVRKQERLTFFDQHDYTELDCFLVSHKLDLHCLNEGCNAAKLWSVPFYCFDSEHGRAHKIHEALYSLHFFGIGLQCGFRHQRNHAKDF